jgi:GT2 family glycosyltransferase
MWWTAATNLGVAYALKSGCDFVLTLNNDLEVTENYLQELMNVHAEIGSCIVGSVSLNIKAKNEIGFCGILWNKFTAKYISIANTYNKSYDQMKTVLSPSTNVKTDILPGRGTLIPKEIFEKIGMFDEIVFPHYGADIDFALRAGKKQYKLIVAINAVLYSHIEATGVNVLHSMPFPNRMKNILFSTKSPNNIGVRYNLAVRHSPLGFLYFCFDMLRIFGSMVKVNK